MRQETLLSLADTAQVAGSSLSKAYLLCQELCERYFQYAGQPYDKARERQDFIIWEYRHYALYAHIIQDYLLQTGEVISSLSGMIHEGLEPGGKNAVKEE